MKFFPLPKPKKPTAKASSPTKGQAKSTDKPNEYRPAGKSSTPVSRRASGPNTATFYYLDTKRFPAVCQEDRNRIKEECDTHGGKQRSKDSMQEARLDPRKHPAGSVNSQLQGKFKEAVTALDAMGKEKSGYKKNAKNAWLEDHCTGQWNKPGGQRDPDDDGTLDTEAESAEKIPNTEEFKKQIEDRVKALGEEYQSKLSEATRKVQEFAADYMKGHIKDALEGTAEKAAKRGALSRFPLIAAAINRLNLYEGLGTLIGNTAGAIYTGDMEKAFDALEAEMRAISQQIEDCKKILSKGGLEDTMASTQAVVAWANPCLKARKCMLVPYKDADKTSQGQGCCPGQTGHHVLPGAMFRKYAKDDKGKYKPDKGANGKVKPRPCWEKYNHDDAPTMCLEGTTNRATNGSHGAAHKLTAELVELDRQKPDMAYTDARDKIANGLGRAFGCNPQCIIEQLDSYYKKVHSCGSLDSATVTPHSGNSGGGPKPAPTKDGTTETPTTGRM